MRVSYGDKMDEEKHEIAIEECGAEEPLPQPDGGAESAGRKGGKFRGKKGKKREKGALTAAFAGKLLDRKWVVVGVITALLVLSFIGLLFVKKNGDVTSYLKDDTNTMIGKSVLEDAYSIQGDLNIAISYLSKDQVQTIYDSIVSDPQLTRMYVTENKDGKEVRSTIISKDVWIGTFDMVLELGEGGLDFGFVHVDGIDPVVAQQIYDSAAKNYVKQTQLGNGTVVTTYILSFYLKSAASDNVTIDALDRIEEIINDNINQQKSAGLISETISAESCYYFGGTAENARILVASSVGDMPIFVAIAVVAVFFILLLTSHSYFEPLIFLATLGISILLNMGSNIIAGNPVGTISTITSSCSTILQLALAMDYAIFLMHTYYEELRIKLNPRDAIISALPKTLASISASALTTIGGFVALFFMQFGMGYDLGFVLAKGVLLSLLTVIILQPVMILLFSKPIMKSQHSWIVEPRLGFVSKNITKKGVAVAVIAICAVICLPCAYFQSLTPLTYISTTEATPTDQMTNPQYVLQDYSNQVIVLVPFSPKEGDEADKTDYVAKQYEFLAWLKTGLGTEEGTHKAEDILSLCTIIPQERYQEIAEHENGLVMRFIQGNFVNSYTSADGSTREYMLYTVNLQGHPEDEESYASIAAIRAYAAQLFGVEETQVYMTGLAQGASDLASVTPDDFMLVNILSAAIIFIILLFTFRSFITSLILLAVIEAGIFFNLAIVYFVSLLAPYAPGLLSVFSGEINFMAYLIVSAIELGATVDYAILFTSKLNEEKAKGCRPERAIRNAVFRSAPSVTTSAAILIAVCLAVNAISSNIIVRQITELIARGTFFSYILVFTLLPSILLFKEKAHAALLKRKGTEVVYDDNAEDLNNAKREAKRARHIEMMQAKAAEFGFDYDPNAPFIDFKQIKADLAAKKQEREQTRLREKALKQAKAQAKKEGVTFEEYLAAHPLPAGDTPAADDLISSDTNSAANDTADPANASDTAPADGANAAPNTNDPASDASGTDGASDTSGADAASDAANADNAPDTPSADNSAGDKDTSGGVQN